MPIRTAAARPHLGGAGDDAQTWSEHCKHKTFTGVIDYDGERIDNLLKHTIKAATLELARPWCVSVFSDNAGIVEFEPGWHVCFKVETHNHPSAIDPYGRLRTGTLRRELSAGDELGDLARSVSNMLSRLQQHNTFLENMPRTLRHEINNPLNVLSTSLQNLAAEHAEVADSEYLESARRGVLRIGSKKSCPSCSQRSVSLPFDGRRITETVRSARCDIVSKSGCSDCQ